jgi:cyclophilin family peptidyl-prolyl cis-trans isomerase
MTKYSMTKYSMTKYSMTKYSMTKYSMTKYSMTKFTITNICKICSFSAINLRVNNFQRFNSASKWRTLAVGMLLVGFGPLALAQQVRAVEFYENSHVDLGLDKTEREALRFDDRSDSQAYLGCRRDLAFDVIDAENRRLAESPVFSDEWIQGVGRSCLKLVLRSAGRIGSDSLLPFLKKHGINSRNPKVRLIAERSLGLFSSAEARTLVLQSLEEYPAAEQSTALMFSLGRLGIKDDLDIFESKLPKIPSRLRGDVYLGLGHLLLKGDGTWALSSEILKAALEDSMTTVQKTSLSAAFALGRYRGSLPQGESNQLLLETTESAMRFWFNQLRLNQLRLNQLRLNQLRLNQLRLNQQQISAEDRLAFLARFAVQFRSAETNKKLIAYLNEHFIASERTRLQVVGLRLMGLFRGQDLAFDSLWDRLQVLTDRSNDISDPRVNEQVMIQLFESIGLLKPSIKGHGSVSERMIRLLEEWQSRGTPWVKKVAFELHAQISHESIGDLIERVYKTPHSLTWKKSVELSLLSKNEDFNSGLFVVIERLNDESKSVLSIALSSLENLEVATLAPEIRSQLIDALKGILARNDEVFLGSVSELAVKLEFWDLQGEVFASLQSLRKTSETSSLVSALKFITKVGKPVDRDQLKWFVSHPDRAVGIAAAESFKTLFSEDLLSQVRESNLIQTTTPSLDAIEMALKSRWVFSTSKGLFSVMPDSTSPLTVANFVALAERGFYNNLSFHRVVPNFVAQGGDPRGDGSGGPGYAIREEASLSWKDHLRGRLGIATSGKDTGGSQFFVNHGANMHLVGTYTSFGHVTSGMDVVDSLTQDDVILSVRVLR